MVVDQPVMRKFLPAALKVENWDSVKSYAADLLQRPLGDLVTYQNFLEDASELGAALSEEIAQRYVAMTCNTADTLIKKRYDDFLEHVMPEMVRHDEALSRRIVGSEFAAQVDEAGFRLLLRAARDGIELFREENVALLTEVEQKAAESDQIKGAMTVAWEGRTYTMPEMSDVLMRPKREKRERAWHAVRERFMTDAASLDKLFDEMTHMRQQIAKNAGFDNFRDYMFRALGRYDYMPQDCVRFQEAIATCVVPLVEESQQQRKKTLGIDVLRPWDLDCDPAGRPALKAFQDADDLIAKGAQVLGAVDPMFRDVLELMRKKDCLDLASRPNKAPGGYNCMMPETGVPFMFGSVTQKQDDIMLLMHEMGHAAHDISALSLRLQAYKSYPAEVAELASMSMELLTHEHWGVFFPDEAESRRARLEHLDGILQVYPWIAMVDGFQHQAYTNPQWSITERHAAWLELCKKYQGNVVDWSGLESERKYLWHKQGHIFTMPFYYIEYGIAQLGALQIWRNFRQDKKQALAQYKAMLKLGNTASLPELYAAAGIRFDFSAELLNETMQFLRHEMDELR